MKHKIYQIDAFADKVFSGNSAAVYPLDQWLSDDILQKIAMENNLAGTAFYVRQENQYQIRSYGFFWYSYLTFQPNAIKNLFIKSLRTSASE